MQVVWALSHSIVSRAAPCSLTFVCSEAFGVRIPIGMESALGKQVSFHERAFRHCRDFPDKSLGVLCFYKHTRKSWKDMSSLLLGLACLTTTKENRCNVEQSWYPTALPYCFKLSTCFVVFMPPTHLPSQNPSGTRRAGWNQHIKYKNFSRLHNQIFWARKKKKKNIFYEHSGIPSCIFSTPEVERF